jgi:putative restriction endonuclease
MALKYFSEEGTNPLRAQQIYQILIGLAYNRQTTTYGQLTDMLGFAGAGVFAGMLGHIMNWRQQHGLPPLTILVVNQETGLPGAGLVTPVKLHKEREQVFNCDWFDLVPPTAAELAAAHAVGHQ